MNLAYPGFYHWYQMYRQPLFRHPEDPLVLGLWPQPPQKEQLPPAPDPLDYGRVAKPSR